MSNIYIQEPSTSGKVLLKTTVGDVEIELWARECPKTCRNFIQLCMEGYYNGTTFHRVVKGFIVQGGDPSGDGTGGESIYGEPFKDEFHSRLRYSRRGLVGMANSDKDDNGSQFFFTMAPTPELQNKNTLFGKVTGDTVFNMLKLEDGLVDHNERPLYAQKVVRAEILSNPFDDIVPRILPTGDVEKKDKKKSKEKGVKNFGLLSFGEEAEEDEEETNDYVQRHSGKAKSMHDMVDDPKLSKQVVKITDDNNDNNDDEKLPDDNSVQVKEEEDDADQRMHRIKSKLKQRSINTDQNIKGEVKVELANSDSEEDNLFIRREREQKVESQKKKEEIRQEILSLKKQYQKDKKIKEELIEKINKKPETETETNEIKNADNNEFIKSFIEEKEKYSNFKSKIPKKGTTRENFTLSLLSKFRSKLDALKQKRDENEDNSTVIDDNLVEKEIQGDDWLAHTLKFEDIVPVLAKDASTKGDDWYDAYDPRNPINKRKRGESSTSKSNLSAKRNK